MRNRFTPKCDHCGKRYPIGNTHGLPNMVGFELEDGRTINVCYECIAKVGTMTETERNDFFDKLKGNE